MIKNILALLMIAISVQVTSAQEMTRKEKRNAKLEKQFKDTYEMLDNRNFVLESDFLQNKYGNRIPVSSTINFVMVEGETAVIQVGSNHGLGYNGVGGVTAKGKITAWELNVNEKKKTFNLQMHVMTTVGNYDLNFFISPSGQATAQLTGIRPGRLIFDGDLVMPENSTVFEGQSL